MPEFGAECKNRGGGGWGATLIQFGTYNIWKGRNSCLKLALRGMGKANMEVGVFKESNFTDGIYTHGSSGYRVVATSAPSRHRGGITLFYQDLPNFVVKAMRQFRAIFIACKLEMGKTRWSIVGCYLVPGDGATIQDMETEVKECPRGIQLIVTGYLNADLERIGGRGQDEEIAAVVATAGLEDL